MEKCKIIAAAIFLGLVLMSIALYAGLTYSARAKIEGCVEVSVMTGRGDVERARSFCKNSL